MAGPLRDEPLRRRRVSGLIVSQAIGYVAFIHHKSLAEGLMGNLFAIGGVALLLVGVLLVALVGERRSAPWAPFIGMTLVVLGLGIELVGAVAVSA